MHDPNAPAAAERDRLHALVANELLSHYLADEIPVGDFRQFLFESARGSAGRIHGATGRALDAVLALLRAAADDDEHPLVVEVVARSQVAWIDDDGENLVCVLLGHVAAALSARAR